MNLLKQPVRSSGRIHHVTPETAGWSYVGFSLYRLSPDETASENTADSEAILVLVEGKAEIAVGDNELGMLGDRLDVFERTPPYSVYAPPSTEWKAVAKTKCTLAVCTAPIDETERQAEVIRPVDVETAVRGNGTNRRHIHNIAMENQPFAERLLVTEVYTPQGHWSSYPPHRHDKDDFPNITYLEETYYHRLKPSQGFGFQRVFTDDGSLDETLCVHNHDVVLVPKGHHPCGVPFGYEMYYLNVMAGPLRHWRFMNHPDHEWLYDFDPDA